MATVFTEATRNYMLDRLNAFPNSSVDGFAIQAYGSTGGTGTLISSEAVTLGSPTGGVRSMTGSCILTIPASSTINSIAISTYDGTVTSNLTQIGYKNLSSPLVYSSIGTLEMTAVTITISNP